MPRDVHLVGSIPLENAAAVFEAVGAALGDHLRRVPDGETGDRTNWIAWQHAAFRSQEALEPAPARERDYQLNPPYLFKAGCGAEDLSFGALGFADRAMDSYRAFLAARATGALPLGLKFMVAIPTPIAPLFSFTAYEAQEAVEPVYTARVLEEVAEICDAIPHDDLSIQWDVATEMSLFERVYPIPFLGDDPDDALMSRLARLGDAVPPTVELGYHLCYGSMNNRHWKEPDDLGMCVRVANGIRHALKRQLDFLHVPVPIDRDDDAYYAPLDGLTLPDDCEVSLGLIHVRDEPDGNRRRIEAASRHLDGFSIGAECGLGRYDAVQVPDLLAVHAETARP